ncbi:amidohydrolase [Parasphingopyxis marina]|uniref:Amidohydrolase n=1 Tax=Parasphingopyxis marina TaxID=2761622 RepID=A0A842HVW2_9SPHN|nr:amidohydrolase [Parasphingopyxis marina]MBC2776567.1 amidohydrolase [Parasphingopyxis marina]
MIKKLMLLAATALAAPAMAQDADNGADLGAAVEADYAENLEALFLDFHRNPELSYRETRTAGIIASQLRALGIEVTEGVGGTGVVGVLENGEGPTILVRADMDGLPLAEDSGLAYASTARQTGIDGVEAPVMHACGHDVHITSLIGSARQLVRLRDRWNGTIVFIAQPAEERIGGARAMMEDGLYERFPRPDYALAFHVSADTPTGRIELQPGLVASSSDSVDIVIHGVGAHGAYPHMGKDPIVMGAEIIMALQTLVSREISPLSPGVVTVGAFHGGIKHNIISDRAEMQLTVRSNDQTVRETLLAGIRRIAENVGRMNGLPEDQLPEVTVSNEATPPTINDAALAARVHSAMAAALGDETILPPAPQTGMGAEDFAYFVQPDTGVRGVYFSVGGTPQEVIDAAENGGPPVPSHHSPFFRITPEPAVTLGTEAMVIAVLDLLAPGTETPAD